MSANLWSFVGNDTKLAGYFLIGNLVGLFILEDAEDLVSFVQILSWDVAMCVNLKGTTFKIENPGRFLKNWFQYVIQA